MKRSRRDRRRSMSSNQWTLLLLFLIILALIALIVLSWRSEPAASPGTDLAATIAPTSTPEPTSTPRPTAIPAAVTAPTLPSSPTAAVFYPTFTVSDCRFTLPRGASITCGVVPVPENREVYPGRSVRLAVAIFHTANRSPAQDPVLYLHDGPIGSAIQWAAVNYDNFVLPITEKRDLIVFDLRGSGLSLPNLDCPELVTVQKLDARGSLTEDKKSSTYSSALITCRDRLVSYGIDLSKYTTRDIAEDVHDIVRALGLEEVNIFATSYGSRSAQIVFKEYPLEIRSAVFDSPSSLSANLYKDAAANYDQALTALFDHCAADPTCNSSYPELSTVYENLIARLDAEPMQITIPGEPGTPDYDLWLDGLTLTRSVLSAINSPYYISSIPKIITALNNGQDLETSLSFIQTSLSLPQQQLLNLSSGMRLSADCHEQVYASTSQELVEAQESFPRTSALGMQSILGDGEILINLCNLWGAKQYDPQADHPGQTEIPVLVLAGHFDTIYPAALAEQLAEDLPGGRFIEVPGSGHAPTFDRRSSCPISLAISFFENPQQALDSSCLEDLALSYYTTYSGEPPLELLPLVNEEMGIQTEIPKGWIDSGQGIYRREAYFGDLTELHIQSSTIRASDWLALLSTEFKGTGFDRTPARNTTRFINRLNWTLYRAFSDNRPIDLALAEAGERTLMVLLFSQSPERDALYRTLFLPAIDATVLR
jgi:pimeloyl-ACP methyl ester carboxylesterase